MIIVSVSQITVISTILVVRAWYRFKNFEAFVDLENTTTTLVLSYSVLQVVTTVPFWFNIRKLATLNEIVLVFGVLLLLLLLLLYTPL